LGISKLPAMINWRCEVAGGDGAHVVRIPPGARTRGARGPIRMRQLWDQRSKEPNGTRESRNPRGAAWPRRGGQRDGESKATPLTPFADQRPIVAFDFHLAVCFEQPASNLFSRSLNRSSKEVDKDLFPDEEGN